MVAFVLSGGGPRGALQAGALQVLLERGIQPDMLVGTSAGAINAAYLACDPTLAGAYRLAEIWRHLTKEQIYPGGLLKAIWHVLTHRDSIYCNDRLRSFLESHAPSGARLFRDLAVRLYIVATDLLSGNPYVFGEPDEPLIDAMMASSALPPALPPWPYRGRVLVDGAVAANLPVGVAIEKGATEIYALETLGNSPPRRLRPNLWEIALWSIDALVHQQVDRDMMLCAAHPEVTLHRIVLATRRRLAFDDFSQAAALIAEGREAATAYLDAWKRGAVGKQAEYGDGWRRSLQRLRNKIVSAARVKRG